ncbi:MAG: hypothetical protein PHD76_00805 [Methylacidiphilales bacterium]|nr:hypothetical protein [Candidatus Methylacidiphilales bacterium]
MLPSSPRIALLACAVIGLGFSAIGRAADPEKTATLAEVRTWGDLLAQKPVTLQIKASPAEKQDATSVEKKPLSFRLGIDRTHAKLYGAVVLYCLAQGDTPKLEQQQTNYNDPCIGPFLIQIQGPLENERAEAARNMVMDRFMISYPIMVHCDALFMKPIPLNQKGSYLITVQQALGGDKVQALASVKVIVSSESEVLWTPWMEPNVDIENNAQPVEDYSEMNVVNPSAGIALPKCDGTEPIFFNTLSDAKHLLPEFISNRPDAGIQLTLKGKELIVMLDEETSIYFPDERFLTRWWVNGKPFLPKVKLPEGTMVKSRALGAADTRVKEVHFKMEFYPEVLGVKKGDTVGVQLLYCPRGWEYVEPPHQAREAMTSFASKKDAYPKLISRLSNRIDFIYSGDPKSIAQP